MRRFLAIFVSALFLTIAVLAFCRSPCCKTAGLVIASVAIVIDSAVAVWQLRRRDDSRLGIEWVVFLASVIFFALSLVDLPNACHHAFTASATGPRMTTGVVLLVSFITFWHVEMSPSNVRRALLGAVFGSVLLVLDWLWPYSQVLPLPGILPVLIKVIVVVCGAYIAIRFSLEILIGRTLLPRPGLAGS